MTTHESAAPTMCHPEPAVLATSTATQNATPPALREIHPPEIAAATAAPPSPAHPLTVRRCVDAAAGRDSPSHPRMFWPADRRTPPTYNRTRVCLLNNPSTERHHRPVRQNTAASLHSTPFAHPPATPRRHPHSPPESPEYRARTWVQPPQTSHIDHNTGDLP